MLFIAEVVGSQGVHFVRIAPIGVRFEVNTRPRPPVGAWLSVELAGLPAPTRMALDDWRARYAPAGELVRPHWRRTVLADLMEAVNGEAHLGLARAASTDELAAFATGSGGALLAEIRAQLAGSSEPTRVRARAERFAKILDVPYASDLLAELAELHAVEQLMGLEHAVAQWIQASAEPGATELAKLASRLPSDRVSAGASAAWFAWWWTFAYRTPRSDLRTATEAVVALAHRECARVELARAACEEATRTLELMRIAKASRQWAEPPDGSFSPSRDEADAHYCAYMAVTHAAHAIAAALRPDHDANRDAMQLVARHALAALT